MVASAGTPLSTARASTPVVTANVRGRRGIGDLRSSAPDGPGTLVLIGGPGLDMSSGPPASVLLVRSAAEGVQRRRAFSGGGWVGRGGGRPWRPISRGGRSRPPSRAG